MPDHHTSPPGLALGDIYYILFRHKWKIAAISAVGIAAAFLLPWAMPLPSQSEAKLFIRYVMDTKSPSQVGANVSGIKSPDERGENIINTELEILTSLDLAQEVVTNIGPEKVLAKAGGGADLKMAAGLVRKNLLAEVPKRSNVIRIVFQHPDPSIVQLVLSQLIDIYLKRHAEIHRATGLLDDSLARETELLRSRLVATEGELRKAKTNAHVISLEDNKKALSGEMARIQRAIFDSEAELAERQASLAQMTKLLHINAGQQSNNPTIQLSLTSSTNPLSSAVEQSSNPIIQQSFSNSVPPDKLSGYKKLSSLLDVLNKREQDLLLELTPESSRIKSIREQIANSEKVRKQLEEDYPALIAVKAVEPKSVDSLTGPRFDLVTEMARVSALESKINVLTGQLARIRKEATVVDEMEGSITELQRTKELQEANYKYFAATREHSRIDDDLAAGHISNISIIQAPSPPFREGAKQQKLRAMLQFGSIAAALALAFLIDLFIDRSLKRPVEIESRLHLPLFISIPLISRNGKRHFPKSRKVPLLPPISSDYKPWATDHGGTSPQDGEGAPSIPNPTFNSQHSSAAPSPHREKSEVAPTVHGPRSTLHTSPALRPFYETLRDRLIAFFELKNLTHKPKLVAVTSCGEGAGVTTTAAGLAASLSETGDGNVLLVDMNLQHGAAHHFHKGNLDCGLDDALEIGKRDTALVQDKLYVVTESTNGNQLPRVLPRRFKNLVPKLRASDYDYIIFDMPPVSQISATPRLGCFMDIVFFVVESEKTDRDVVKRATDLLAESKCNLGVILNKSKTYVPKLLQQEL